VQKYLTIEKRVGETPLQALERARVEKNIDLTVPLAYAGRLDPMASGKLLILIGDECKRQEHYHASDKEYVFQILFNVGSDTGDVLGGVAQSEATLFTFEELYKVIKQFRGKIALPYPHFSSKTVRGKPLHMWALENRLSEIEIPTKHSQIYALTLSALTTIRADELYQTVMTKIESIPEVTDPRKALGADFRRDLVRKSWESVYDANPERVYQLATITCIASSGTYMRSLAEEIGKKLGTTSLAYSIHRTKIGSYIPCFGSYGFWIRSF